MSHSDGLRHEKISELIPLSTSDPQGRHSSALAERRWRSPLNFRIRADFSSTEPHLDPPILLPTVRGVV